MRCTALVLALSLLACDEDADAKRRPKPPPPPTGPVCSDWEIGPVISGYNYSLGLPLHPTLEANGECSFAISTTAEPHYITRAINGLAGKTKMTLVYRAEGAVGTLIHGKGCAVTSPSSIVPYFQRAGDNWSADGYRWWAPYARIRLDKPSAGAVAVLFAGPWVAHYSLTAVANPTQFAAAKTNAGRIGFTFANCEGQGHGARATAPVKFVIASFTVE